MHLARSRRVEAAPHGLLELTLRAGSGHQVAAREGAGDGGKPCHLLDDEVLDLGRADDAGGLGGLDDVDADAGRDLRTDAGQSWVLQGVSSPAKRLRRVP